MAGNLFDPPPKYGIPLSRGGDIYLKFILTVPDPSGETETVEVDGQMVTRVKRIPVDFPAGSTMTFAIALTGSNPDSGTGDPDVTVVEEVIQLAEINGSEAIMLMDHLKLDNLSFDENQTWRLTYTSAEGVDSPVANGWTYRADGEEDDGF